MSELRRKNKPKRVIPTTIKNGGKMITVSKNICNEMNSHFVILGEKLDIQMTDTNNKTYVNFLGNRQVASVYLRPTKNQEMIKINACFNIRKSPGYIDIPTTLIKKLNI